LYQKPTYEKLEQRVQELEKSRSESKQMEQALRESEEYLSSIFRSAPIGIGLVVNRELKKVNTRLCMISGYEEGELIGQSSRILYPSIDDFEFVGREKYAQIRDHGTGTVETQWQRKDGGIIDILLSSTPVDMRDYSKGVTFTALDITERKNTEERHRTIIQTALDGFWLTDINGKLLEVNESYCRMSGYRQDELLSMSIVDLEVNVIQKDVYAHIQEIIEKGTDRFETKHYRKDGTVFDVEIITQFRKQEGGRCVCFLRDITDRKQADKAQKESEEYFRQINDHMAVGLAKVSLDFCIEHVNEAYSQMLGYSKEELIGKNIRDITQQEDLDENQELHAQVAAGKIDHYRMEKKFVHKTGSVIHGILDSCLVRNSGGMPDYLVGSVINISELKQAELELRESEERNRLLSDLTMEGIVIHRNGVAIDLNSSMTKMLDFDRDELLNKNLMEFIHVEDRAIVRENITKDYAPPYNVRMVRKEGEYFFAEIESHNFHRQGEVWRVSAVRDITERKQAEAALQASEEKFRTVASYIHNWEYWIDGDGNLVYVSPSCEQTTSYTEEEFYQDPGLLTRIIRPDDRVSFMQHVDNNPKCTTDEDCQVQDFRILTRNGEERWISHVCRNVFDKEGKHIGRRVSNREITKQKLAEAELVEYAQRLKLATASGKFAVWDWSVKNNSMFWDDRMLELYGISRDKFSSNIDAWTNGLHPDDKQRVIDEKNAALLGEKEFDTTFRVLHTDGTIKHIKATAMVTKDQNGKAIRMIGINSDITEKVQAGEEKKILETHLQQAQKMEAIGTLAGGIAHDFNNILSAILGYADMAYQDSLSGSVKSSHLHRVIQAGNRAADLVKQILAFSRQAETQRIPMRPVAMVKESLKLIRSSLPTTIDVQQDIDSETSLILADPTQIHQIIMNLCTNAYHAMEENGGTLSISLKNKDLTQQDLITIPGVQQGHFIQLSVRDTGPGISPEIRKKIFDPYFTTKEAGKGTGMGLAIVHGIVKACGGYITCNSEIGEGTSFETYLPSLLEQIEPETKEWELVPIGTESILFIDDEELLTEMGQTMLERLGYSVTTKMSSVEALATFKNKPDAFDLVITDQTMPGMTGVDLARRMLHIRPDLPIILYTGYSSQISKEDVKSCGIKGFAMKPLVRKDIAVLIRKVLD
jgi:PAS domain S-box-containing protein